MIKYSIRCNLLPATKADGTHSIRMRVSWCGKRISHCISSSVRDNEWDASIGLPTRMQRNALREIEELKVSVDRLFDRCRLDGRMPSETEVRIALGEDVEEDLSSRKLLLTTAMNSIMNDSTLGGSWGTTTRKSFIALINHIREWNELQTLDGFDRTAMEDFMNHCFGIGLKNVTIMKFMKKLRWTMNVAKERGMCDGTDASTFYPKYKAESENDVVYLTKDELRRVMDLDLSGIPHLERVRDVFVFCCFSGLRYSDVEKLSRADIHGDHMTVITKKTASAIYIELNDVTRSIISKYACSPHCSGDAALPVISNAKMNKFLKKIGQMAQLNEPVRKVWWVRAERHEETKQKWEALSTHCGRKTFVVTALSLNIASEVVMKWTGHRDHQTMKPYIAIVDELKKSEMTKFNNLVDSCDRFMTENPSDKVPKQSRGRAKTKSKKLNNNEIER